MLPIVLSILFRRLKPATTRPALKPAAPGTAHEKEASSRKDLLPYLPLFMVLWANLHAGCIVGLSVMFLIAAGEGVTLIFARTGIGRGDYTRFLLYASLTAAATLATPYTYHLYSFLFSHLDVIRRIRIAEFRPLSFSDPSSAAPLAVLLLFLLLFLAAIKRFDIGDVLLFLPSLVLPFIMRRWIGDSLIVTAAVLGGRLPPGRWRRPGRAVGIVLLLIPVAAYGLVYKTEGVRYLGLGITDTVYPQKALDFIDRLGLPGNIYNSSNYGGAVIFRWFPDKKAIQDTRLVSARENIESILGGLAPSEAAVFFDRVLSRLDVTHALVELSAQYRARGLFPMNTWALLYWDDSTEVFVRKDASTEKILNKYKEFSFNPEALVAHLETSDNVPAGLINELKRAIELNPDGIMARAVFARAEMLSMGDLPEAWDVLKTGLGKNSNSFYAAYVAARLHAAMGRQQDAWGFCASMRSLRRSYGLTRDALGSYLGNVSAILISKGLQPGSCQ